jgi:hypothetical protein
MMCVTWYSGQFFPSKPPVNITIGVEELPYDDLSQC